MQGGNAGRKKNQSQGVHWLFLEGPERQKEAIKQVRIAGNVYIRQTKTLLVVVYVFALLPSRKFFISELGLL